MPELGEAQRHRGHHRGRHRLGGIDGQQIDVPPGVLYEPGNATLTYTPSENAPIERFESGPHTVTVIYWKILEGPGAARSYTWSFTTV